MKPADLSKLFDYKPPTRDQIERFAEIRAQAKRFGAMILKACPASAEQTLAIRKLEESLHYAIASIVREPNVAGRSLDERFSLFKSIESKLKADEAKQVAGFLGLNDLLDIEPEEPEPTGESNGKAQA
jgi:hypothetical protein